MDMQAADAVSYRNFMADLAAFYRGGDLPELGYTYREYRAALTASDPPTVRRGPPVVGRADPRAARTACAAAGSACRTGRPAAQHPAVARLRRRRPATRCSPPRTGAASRRRWPSRRRTPNALARWSTGSRFLLNLPMFGREQFHPDVEKLVGDFTSSLMLDVDLTQTDTAAARARAVQETLHATARHSQLLGPVGAARPEPPSRRPDARADRLHQRARPRRPVRRRGHRRSSAAPVWTISQGPQVLIDAQATPLADGLMINWDVRDDAFRPGVADAMFAYHLAELTRLATDDAAGTRPIRPRCRRRAARRARGASTRPPRRPAVTRCTTGSSATPPATPDAPAVVQQRRRPDLRRAARQVLAVGSDACVDAGSGPATSSRCIGPKSAEQIPALLGILAVGAAYLPIGVDQPAERASRILDAGAVACECARAGAGRPSPSGCAGRPVADAIASDAADPCPPRSTRRLAYVLFTSGSTGEPKGVEVTHDAAMNTVEFINAALRDRSGDRCLALSTLECDLSVLDIFGILRAGGAVVVVDEEHRRDPDNWAELIDAHRVTVLNFMPGWLEMLLPRSARRGCRRCGWCCSAATGSPRTHARGLRACAPGVRVRRARRRHRDRDPRHDLRGRSSRRADWTAVPYGMPLPNNACRVVAADGADCPDWVPGELWVSRAGDRPRLPGRPDLTAAEVRRARRPNLVPHRRSARYLARRHPRVRRPRRPPGQDQRLPGRTRRGRGRAARGCRG